MGDRCPTPNKATYRTESAANHALALINSKGGTWKRPNRTYLCDCGMWHLAASAKER